MSLLKLHHAEAMIQRGLDAEAVAREDWMSKHLQIWSLSVASYHSGHTGILQTLGKGAAVSVIWCSQRVKWDNRLLVRQ